MKMLFKPTEFSIKLDTISQDSRLYIYLGVIGYNFKISIVYMFVSLKLSFV